MIITYDNITYDCNDELSMKNFTNIPKVGVRNNLIVYASNFSQETPDSHIFRDNMNGVTFIKCNLMNVYIPSGNTVIDCQTQRFKVQRDARDWFIDADGNPTEVVSRKYWESIGYSVDPADIPTENPINEETMPRRRYNHLFGENGPGHPIFVGTPDIIEDRGEMVVVEGEGRMFNNLERIRRT